MVPLCRSVLLWARKKFLITEDDTTTHILAASHSVSTTKQQCYDWQENDKYCNNKYICIWLHITKAQLKEGTNIYLFNFFPISYKVKLQNGLDYWSMCTGFVVLTRSFRKDGFWSVCGLLGYTVSISDYIVLNRGWFNE
jgi:hypothetical protein